MPHSASSNSIHGNAYTFYNRNCVLSPEMNGHDPPRSEPSSSAPSSPSLSLPSISELLVTAASTVSAPAGLMQYQAGSSDDNLRIPPVNDTPATTPDNIEGSDIEFPYMVPDEDSCVACAIPIPNPPGNSNREYTLYKVGVDAPNQDDGPLYKLFVATGSDTYPFGGIYMFVDGRLDADNAYHEHPGNSPPGTADYICHEEVGTVPAANFSQLQGLCRRVLPPRQQSEGGNEFCPWVPLYRSEDWVDDIITLGGRARILEPGPNHIMGWFPGEQEDGPLPLFAYSL